MTEGEPHPQRPEIEIPPYLELLWSGERADRPGPKRGIDLAGIAAAGIGIADTEGVGAVSMRRLATELGYTTMALYRYVRSKDELMMLLIDAAFGPPPESFSDVPGWRAGLTAWATALRAALIAHPWILEIPPREPPAQPNQIAWTERGLQILAATGLSEQDKLSSLLLVDVFVRGQTHLSQNLLGTAAPGGLDPGIEYVTRLMTFTDDQRYPHLRRALLSGAFEDDDVDFSADEFAFGLQTVLDGIEARTRRPSRPRSAH